MDLSILLMFAAFGLLIAIEVPIAFALAGSALLYLMVNPVVPLTIVVQRMAPGIDSFPLLAVPLFILAGQLLNTAGIATRIFRFAHALVGHIRGGLAHCNVVASMIFSAMSGVAQADAAGLGLIEVKAMRERGFDPAFCGSRERGLGHHRADHPAERHHGDLRAAGPGLGGRPVPRRHPARGHDGPVADGDDLLPRRDRPRPLPGRAARHVHGVKGSFLAGLPAFLAPVMLVGGLVLGIATPTELGAITVVYAIALGFWYGELTWKQVFEAATEPLVFYGVLVFIIAAAVPFGWLISFTRCRPSWRPPCWPSPRIRR